MITFLVDSSQKKKKRYSIVIWKKEPRTEALEKDRWNKKLKKKTE